MGLFAAATTLWAVVSATAEPLLKRPSRVLQDGSRPISEKLVLLDHPDDLRRHHGLPRRIARLELRQRLGRMNAQVFRIVIDDLLDEFVLHEIAVERPQ